jgi:hypothetical protein
LSSAPSTATTGGRRLSRPRFERLLTKTDEKRDTYHGKRGRRDIDYLLLTQLWKIINHKWKDFEPLFPPGKHWVQSMIDNDMNVSRRPIAHMNPLEDDDINNVETAFRKWVKNLKAVADKLPST